MADLFEYLRWRGDLSFCQAGLNPVDALIFSALGYLQLDGLVPAGFANPVPLEVVADAFAALPDKDKRLLMKNDDRVFQAAAGTERFRDVKLIYYRSETVLEQESQFGAVAFLLPDDTAVLSFRGTDRSLVGWKEDFNMSFQPWVPAQEKALYYTQTFAQAFDRELVLCGHSKGGNLAVYAGSRCPEDIQKRIRGIYNNDGPGFTAALMGDPGYKAMVPKIHTYVPQSSVVGMLLEHEEPYAVVKSRQVSFLQHDLYSWEVMGGDFVPMEQLTEDSVRINQTLKTWIAGMSLEDRNAFVDALFDMLNTGETDDPWKIMLPRNIRSYLKTLNEDEQMRKTITKELTGLVRTAQQRWTKSGDALPEGQMKK